MAGESDRQRIIAEIAKRHQVSVGAVDVAAEALRHGGGSMAQFSHQDFGGMAQWSRDGMSMVGDMFNGAMKAQLDGVMADLVNAHRSGSLTPPVQSSARGPTRTVAKANWWPEEFGEPSSAGGQNDMRYAFFPKARRLVVEDGERQTVYDTGTHQIHGVSQQQSGMRSLAFTSQHGQLDLDSLEVIR